LGTLPNHDFVVNKNDEATKGKCPHHLPSHSNVPGTMPSKAVGSEKAQQIVHLWEVWWE